MRVFRRRNADATGSPQQQPTAATNASSPGQPGGVQVGAPDDTTNGSGGPGRPGMTPAKGRPTPKRSEAERRRRQPYSAPADRKAAVRQGRGRDRTERNRRYAALRRGEEWALPPKDRGPVRALARDLVDSRRRISEFYMYGLGVLLVLLFVLRSQQAVVDLLVLGMVLIILTEGILLGRQVKKLAAERFPGESTRGIRFYAALRAMQLRKLRMPAPRVKPGDTI